MKIVAVVPMKLNNQRLPQKNTKSFHNGKPLCYYILSTLLTIKIIDEVYVYCSNPEIKKYIPDGAKYLQRSTELDLDTTKMNEVLESFALEIPADYYVMTHTTAPFISADSISRGIEGVLSKKFDSAFAAKKLQDFLWSEGRPYNYNLNSIPRTQDLDPLFQETSGFYIYDRGTILEKKRRIGDKPYIVEVGEIESIDIDEPEDFVIADSIYNFVFLHNEKKYGKKEPLVEILDCTLRDGGYCNNWIFGTDGIIKIINGLVETGIDVIECGFLSNRSEEQTGISKYRYMRQVDECIMVLALKLTESPQ